MAETLVSAFVSLTNLRHRSYLYLPDALYTLPSHKVVPIWHLGT